MRVDYTSLDGSPFPVTFADPSHRELRWVLDREHAPIAMTPLADTVLRVGREGSERAYADSGLRTLSTMLREPPMANGGTLGVWLNHSVLTGAVEAKTAGGSIHVDGADHATVVASTSGGSIHVRGRLVGHSRIRTSAGSVTLSKT